MSTQAIATVDKESTQISKAAQLEALEISFAVGVRQRELLELYIQTRLKPSKHFYHVEGSDKPSLSKDGAEFICLPHGYRGDYDWIGGPKEPPADDVPYQITLNCRLMKRGEFMGGGMGSASSHITKRDGDRIPRQRDPGLRHNATIKMAQKSAYIAATLSATAASEFFTQDMEDSPDNDSDKSQHWCETHQTNWFKRGKMRRYAHPIADTDQWCNEPSASKNSNGDQTTPVPTQAQPPVSITHCALHGNFRMGLDAQKRRCHKLPDGTFCYGVAPEAQLDTPDAVEPPEATTFSTTPLSDLQRDVDQEMEWATFEQNVLKMPWSEWVRLTNTPIETARTRWGTWKQQQQEAQR